MGIHDLFVWVIYKAPQTDFFDVCMTYIVSCLTFFFLFKSKILRSCDLVKVVLSLIKKVLIEFKKKPLYFLSFYRYGTSTLWCEEV